MSPSSPQPPASSLPRCNVADRLAHFAATTPQSIAVARPAGGDYQTCTFAELDADATALAHSLVDLGIRPGMRLVLLVPPGIEFVKLVFALLRTGATTVLVDPGMGRRQLVHCLAATDPDGFIAVPRAQAVRTLLGRRFPHARFNVTIGRRLFWRGPTYRQLLAAHSPVGRDPKSAKGSASPPSRATLPSTHPDDPAAIIFTSGSTGPPKGVLYTHRMFETQAAEIQRAYNIQPGGVDLACFALFGLFNSTMGVTTVFPNMDFSRPAAANPQKLLAAANDWKITQAFASPAVWDKLSRHCEQTGDSIPTLRKVLSCGAPVPADVLRRTLDHVAAPGAQMHTPYGATEALPVATIEANEVLTETAAKTATGAGVCVGRKVDSIDWRVIRISDAPITSIDEAEQLPTREIGELIVRGPQVAATYLDLPAPSPRRGGLGRAAEASTSYDHASQVFSNNGRESQQSNEYNAQAKIRDDSSTWHRMGDVGYLDDQGRFWYCGRKSQRVETAVDTLYTECVEPIFSAHFWVRRTALVGVGQKNDQTPIILFEPRRDIRTIYPAPGGPHTPGAAIQLVPGELAEIAQQHQAAAMIKNFMQYDRFPVDIRHNAKINREALAAWAAQQLKTPTQTTR